jgi:hypothetical protein
MPSELFVLLKLIFTRQLNTDNIDELYDTGLIQCFSKSSC